MCDTGIDWDHYDHGPGSEEHKYKMAAEQREYDDKVSAERAATQTQADRVPALEAEIEGLRDDIQYALDRLSTREDQGPGLRVLIDAATNRGDYFPSCELKRRDQTIAEINHHFASFQDFHKEVFAELDAKNERLREERDLLAKMLTTAWIACQPADDPIPPPDFVYVAQAEKDFAAGRTTTLDKFIQQLKDAPE